MSFKIDEVDKLSSSTSGDPCHIFSLAEIQLATNDFDNKLVIGRGGFGRVYKGNICIEETSHVVAIKRLDSMSDQGEHEFRAEIEMLSKLHHRHLVSLIGYCDDKKEMILVYEYMPHGTLYDHIHEADAHLDWMQRMKIAIGAGCGLDYLHTTDDTKLAIIHRDVKSSNILLDESLAAMISDFGLSKIGPTDQSFVLASVKGTFGYLDPEYFYTKKLTMATDVYAFGVVLFELLSGRLPVDIGYGEEQCSLVRWAQKSVKERKFKQMVDPTIKEIISAKCLRRFAQIADRCVHVVPKDRPTMTEVVASLQGLLELQKKYENSAEPSGTAGFTSKMNKYFRFSTKVNSNYIGTLKRIGDNMDIYTKIATIGEADANQEMPHSCTKMLTKDLKKFTRYELKCASRGFRFGTCLSEWRYGKIYKGWINEMTYSPSELDIGLAVFIKIFQRGHSGSLNNDELDVVLTKLSHPNIVKLIGYCLEGDVLFLVYEFMYNGNFEDCLHSGAVARLPLDARVKMALEIARGLVFFYNTQDQTASDLSWIHKMCVFERGNILLDEHFTAKFWEYNVWKLRTWHDKKIDCYYHSDCWRPKSLYGRSNLTSFTVVLAEILIGELVPGSNGYKNLSLQEFGKHFRILKEWKSLGSLAKLCLEICNDVDSEVKMLRALKKLYPSITEALAIATTDSRQIN